MNKNRKKEDKRNLCGWNNEQWIKEKLKKRRVPQVTDGKRHWEGSWEAILRVLQRQSRSTAWSALQHVALGLVLDEPGTTKGAQTFRLLNSVVQALRCALAIRLTFPTTNNTNKASWQPKTDFAATAITSITSNTVCLCVFYSHCICFSCLECLSLFMVVKFGSKRVLHSVSHLPFSFSTHSFCVAWQLNMRMIVSLISFLLCLAIYF